MMGSLGKAGRCRRRDRSCPLPPDHLLRRIDAVLDLGLVRDALEATYSTTGRPSFDPELLIRMLLIARLYAIGSERRLCDEVRYNVAYRWFCGLAAGDRVPHHSTLSKNRHGRFATAGVLRKLFDTTVKTCMNARLVEGRDAAVDASFVEADANWRRRVGTGDELAERQALGRQSRAVKSWLVTRGASPHRQLGPPPKEPSQLSLTDPASGWSAKSGMGRFGYAINVLADMPSGVIVDVEASPARFAAEVNAAAHMIERSAGRAGYRPKRLLADVAYGSTPFLVFMRAHGTIAHVPVLERSGEKNGKLPRSVFSFDPVANAYTCPQGERLTYMGMDHVTRVQSFKASPMSCRTCAIRASCTDGRCRGLTRMADEDVRDQARAVMRTGLYRRSMILRRSVERIFAEMKTRHGLTRLRLRGRSGAEESFLLAATVINLRLLARPTIEVQTRRRRDPYQAKPNGMERISLTQTLGALAAAA